MFDKLEMKIIPMSDATSSCTLAEAIKWAEENLDAKNAWLLGESPRQVIWGGFADKISAPGLEECLFLLMFDKRAEGRFYRQNRAGNGTLRQLAEDPQGKPTLARLSGCLIKNGDSLDVAEHFRQDDNGLYQLAYSRYCGVRSRK